MFSLATPIACMTVGMARHDEEIRRDVVGEGRGEVEEERENGGRKLPFDGGVKCNSENDQTGMKLQQRREMRTRWTRREEDR